MTLSESNDLAAGHLALAFHLAKVYYRRARAQRRLPFYDDVASEAQYALVLASRAFDPSRGVCFRTFSCMCIRRHLHEQYIRNRHRNLIREKQEGSDIRLEHCGCRSDLDTLLAFKELGDGLATLNENQRTTLDLWANGQTFAEIGANLGFTGERARQVWRQAIGRMRQWTQDAAIRAMVRREQYAAA